MDLERAVFSVPLAVLVLGGIYQLVRYRSLPGANLGARILETVGEIEFGRGLTAGSKIRVLRLDGDAGDPVIGVDSLVPTLAPNRLAPFSLTKEQARALGALLSEAGKA